MKSALLGSNRTIGKAGLLDPPARSAFWSVQLLEAVWTPWPVLSFLSSVEPATARMLLPQGTALASCVSHTQRPQDAVAHLDNVGLSSSGLVD